MDSALTQQNAYQNLVDTVPAKLSLAPQIDMDDQADNEYIMLKGPQWYQPFQESAITNSNSSMTFSVTPPSVDIAVDRRMWVEYDAEFTLTAADDGNPVLPSVTFNGNEYLVGSTDALRFLPLQSVTESLSLDINGKNFSSQPADYIDALCRCNMNDEMRNGEWSTFPSMQDTYQSYKDSTLFGQDKNPLASFGNNSGVLPRGAFRYTISENSNTQAKVTCRVIEPLMVSPLQFNSYQFSGKGFVGITNINVRFNLGTLSRMWSRDETNNKALTDISVSLNSNNCITPRLHLNYYTLPSNYVQPVPKINTYSLNNVIREASNATVTLAAQGNHQGLRSPVLQLSSIPKRVMIAIREINSDRDYTKTDTYARIDKVDGTWENKNGIFAGARSVDLYNISRSAGLNMSWPEWNYYTGSVLVLNVGDVFPMADNQAVGLGNGKYTLSFSVDFTNLSDRQITYQMYVMVIDEGVFTLNGSQAMADYAPVNNMNIVKGISLGELPREHRRNIYDVGFQGGSFWGAVKRAASKALNFGKKAFNWAKDHREEIGQAAKLAAPLLGLGYSNDEVQDYLNGRGMNPNAGYGGAQISRRDLRELMN